MSARRPLPPAVERAGILVLGLAATYVALVPLGSDGPLPMPDLGFCLVAAWVIRRPANAPLWMVLALGLLGDLMLSRPLGLGALGLLIATERLRALAGWLHGSGFVLEWLVAAAAFAGILIFIQAMLLLVFVNGPAAGTTVLYLGSTALAYPPVALALGISLRLHGPGRTGGRISLGRLP